MRQGPSIKPQRTDDLIQGLALQAGRRNSGSLTFSRALPLGVVASILIAFVIVVIMVGPRADLPQIANHWIFQFKAIAMGLLAGGAALLVRAAAMPGTTARPLAALAPGLVFMAVNLLTGQSAFPLLGLHPQSVVNCVGAIVIASLPPLAVILATIRRGAPTRLRRAGAMAGVLAGSLGALAYAVACVNDGVGFVSLWYVSAILIVATIGAVAAPRALAW